MPLRDTSEDDEQSGVHAEVQCGEHTARGGASTAALELLQRVGVTRSTWTKTRSQWTTAAWATNRSVDRHGEDADKRPDDHDQWNGPAPRLPRQKLREQRASKRFQCGRMGRSWSWDVGEWVRAVTGVREQRPARRPVVRDGRSEKRTPKLPLSRASMDARCPCARTPSKKRESAWHAHGSHGLQGAFALVSGLYGAWETRSACGALVGSRKHRSRRAQGGARTQRLLPFSG